MIIKKLKSLSISSSLWKLSFIIMIIPLLSVLHSITVETASLTGFMYGTEENAAYDDFYHRVVEGLASSGYNQYAPWDRQTNGFGNFVNANQTQRDNWGSIVDLFLMEMFTEAQGLIDLHGFPYEVVEFHDTDTDRTYYMLREELNMDYFDDNDLPDQPQVHQHGSFDYGWGLYVFNPSSDVPVIVNVVHPKDDFISIPVATRAFQIWDARYMMIAGAGREVLWTNVPPFFNSKSLSDPSRNLNHVFNVTYSRIAEEIRTTFERREHSVQIHSFDYTHTDYKSLQISGGGWAYDYPGLPIRDISGNYLDMINASPYVIFPANTIGSHDEVLVTDYYSVLYDTHGLYYNHEGEYLPISNNINLPGADVNRQVAVTQSGWNKYDVFTPFLHIEMEELPSIYPQTMNYYRWLYGYDAVTQTWNSEEFWTRTLQYYTPWLEHYAQVLPHLLAFDDGEDPNVPANLTLVSSSHSNVVLDWDRSYSYDFETYEILYATEPIDLDNPNYTTRSRNNISTLAGQAFTRATVTGLQPATEYYFRIRARDYNGNYSALSNEISVVTGSATITNLRAFGRDAYVDVSWLAQLQTNNQGFAIWRAVSDTGDYEMIDSYATNHSLAGSTENNVNYSFVDDQVENGVFYDYKVASVDSSNVEYMHVFVATASARPIYTLTIQNDSGTISDTVEFGSNPFATDGYDSNFDILKGGAPGGQYIYAMSYKSNWSVALRNLQRDIYAHFDTDMRYKTYVIRISTNQTNQPIAVSICDSFGRNSEKLYLRDNTTGNMVDLTEEPLIYEAANTSYRYFTLYWGNLLPVISFPNIGNRFLQAGDEFNFTWTTNFSLLVNSIDLYLSNGTDSLHVVSSLPGSTTSYEWTVPDNLEILNASLVVRTNVVDGFPLDSLSGFKFGVVPSTVVFNNAAGWHLKANPLVSPAFPGSVLLGPESLLYSYDYDEEGYNEETLYQFGQGYWAYLPVSYELGTTGTIRKLQYDITLQEGWNLVPNVFLSDINTRDFRFRLDGNNYTFIEAYQYNMIERSVYKVKDDGYHLSNNMDKQGAIWLYSYVPGLILRLIPFLQNPDHTEIPFNWQATITVRQDNHLKDEVIIGSSQNSSEGYDPLYDLPKPPPRPASDFYFYLPADETTHPFTELHSYYKSELANDESDARYWNFVMHIDPEMHPVRFRKSAINLPSDYHVVLIIHDNYNLLSEDQDYIYYPHSTTIEGEIMVTNDETSSVEELPETSMLFSNYPNPFFAGGSSRGTTGTNITFYLNKPEKVKLEIFNIKGQKVKTLFNDRREAGRYTVHWEGRDQRNNIVASGVYLYRLHVGDSETHVKKMMLLK